MVFSSLLFLFRFLPVVLIGYFILPRKYRNLFLLLFSLFFYAWGEPTYVALMLFSIFVNYLGGIFVDKSLKKENKKSAKIFLIISMIIDIGLLGVFKYTGFFLDNLNALAKTDFAVSILLPIGISFYTFQMIDRKSVV